MSDERTRNLEAAAARGEPGAAEALARARCRVEGHDFDLGGVIVMIVKLPDDWLERQIKPGEKSQMFRCCRRCGGEEPWSPRSGEPLYVGTSGRFQPPPPAPPIGFALAATGEDPAVSIQLPGEGPVVSLARERERHFPRGRRRRRR